MCKKAKWLQDWYHYYARLVRLYGQLDCSVIKTGTRKPLKEGDEILNPKAAVLEIPGRNQTPKFPVNNS